MSTYRIGDYARALIDQVTGKVVGWRTPADEDQLTDPLAKPGSRTVTVDAITSVNATALGLVDGDVVVARGRSAAGDGGGGTLNITNTPPAVAAGEDGLWFDIGGGLYAERDGLTATGFNGDIAVAMFGAKGDGTAEHAAIRLAIDAAAAFGGAKVYFSQPEYRVGAPLYWKNGVYLVSRSQTTLKVLDGVDSLVVAILNSQTTPAITNIGAEGITFDGNRQNSPGLAANSAVALDPVDGATFTRCNFKSARGYGASLQYLASGVPDNERIKNISFLFCDFYDNGYGTAIPGTEFDGVDVKNCNGLTFIRCRAYDNALDGFDFRGINIDMIACEAYDNGGDGIEISANSNGNNQNSSLRVLGGSFHDNGNFGIGVANNPAGGTGTTTIDVIGSDIYSNTDDGLAFIGGAAATTATIRATIRSNGGRGVDIAGNNTQIILDGCAIRLNTSDGVYCNGGSTLQINGGQITGNGGWGYLEGASGTRNLLGGTLRILSNTSGSISINTASPLTRIAPSVTDYNPFGSAPNDLVASASTMTLPAGGDYFVITGSTTITNITAAHRGRLVTLRLNGTITVTDGGNLRLAGTFNAVQWNTLTLRFEGPDWVEVARSVN